MQNPKTLCMLPWVSLETTPLGTTRPCCMAIDEILQPNGEKYDLKEHTLKDIFQSDYMKDLREQFLKGERPKTCQRCWDEEDAGRTSKRMNTDIRFKHEREKIDYSNIQPEDIWFLDLKLGNICNLKCRICGSWSSSKWAAEEIEYHKKEWKADTKFNIAHTWLKQGRWPRESDIFWEHMETILPNIRHFEFTGGEPFMIQEHFNLLQRAVDLDLAKNIEIHYNTNGTHYPEQHIDLWKQFKYVEIAFSIDNVGKRFELERYGADWEQVQENIKKFKILREQNDNIQLQICMTINAQNVYYLKDLCDWVSKQNFDYDHFNMLHDPRHMNIGEMTKAAKDLVINRLTQDHFPPQHRDEIKKIIQFIKNGPTGDGEKFVRLMKKADEFRNESFLETHTPIARAMGYTDENQ